MSSPNNQWMLYVFIPLFYLPPATTYHLAERRYWYLSGQVPDHQQHQCMWSGGWCYRIHLRTSWHGQAHCGQPRCTIKIFFSQFWGLVVWYWYDVGKTTISNDGATIMKLLDVVHPAAKTLVDISLSQDAEVSTQCFTGLPEGMPNHCQWRQNSSSSPAQPAVASSTRVEILWCHCTS